MLGSLGDYARQGRDLRESWSKSLRNLPEPSIANVKRKKKNASFCIFLCQSCTSFPLMFKRERFWNGQSVKYFRMYSFLGTAFY